MKKLKLFLCLTTGMLLIISNSCKKDIVNLNQGGNISGITAVSQLPADQLIQPKEIINWVSNYAGSSLNPAWDKAMQSVVNGHHTIELPTSADAALFFTKVNGVLDVYAYKWLDAKPGAKKYTGAVLYYSFQEGAAYVLGFVKGKVTSKTAFNLSAAKGYSLSAVKGKTLSAIGSKQAVFDSGNPSVLDWIWCMLSGGDWFAGSGCNPYNQGDGGLFGNIWNAMKSIVASIFGSSDESDNGNSTNDGSNTPVNNNNTGVVVVTGNDGSSATIDGSSVISGASAYIAVTVNIPCTPGQTTSGDGTQSLQDGSSGDPDPCPNGYTTQTQWIPWTNVDPASTDSNFSLSDYISISDIDNDLNDVAVLPNSTINQPDDTYGYSFDPSTDANFLNITFDQSFSSNTRLSNIYNRLSSNYTMQKVLSKFFGKNNPISLEFRAQTLTAGTRGQTYPIGATGNPYSDRIVIIIDPDANNTRPDLMIAKTIIHEVIHAEIYRILRLEKLNILPSDYNKILNSLIAYYNAYPLSNPKVVNKVWDHGYMAIHFLSAIADGLKEYDNNPNIPLCFYKMLAWEGLEGTPYWNKLSSSDRQYITAAISNYISNQTVATCLN